jgi:hypothetical protein
MSGWHAVEVRPDSDYVTGQVVMADGGMVLV